MRRRIAVLLLVILAVALAVNTVVTDNETEPAHERDGGTVLRLEGGNLNHWTDFNQSDPGVTLVLLHCFTCSLRWWEPVAREMARDHRVVRLDLLGHGGSEKPKEGYSMENQARLVEQALDRLRVRRATVVGHSMGGAVATALAERAPERVERVVIVDSNPTTGTGKLPLTARIGFWPVIGEAANRIVPDFAVEDALGEAFAPGFDTPDYALKDFRALTYSAYDKSAAAGRDFREEKSLTERLTEAGRPVMAVFGSEDQIVDVEGSLAEYRKIPGVEVHELAGVGHSPPVERPRQLVRLIRAFER
jgi:pimeloyl-ACP methyl ester carboxylesterase